MSGKQLTPQQEKAADKIYFQSGIKGAAIGLGLGLAATVFTFRRSPEFRALSRPLQSIMAASSEYSLSLNGPIQL
jgi:hypothetical protein